MDHNTAPEVLADHIAARVQAPAAGARRKIIAVAGPPASGKSTLAKLLCARLNARGMPCGLLPMDGFHLDNSLLEPRGLLAQKGAPETFDIAGFASSVLRVAQGGSVFVPTFDRDREIAIAASAEITADMRVVVAEGNYLFLNEPGWVDLRPLWDMTVLLAPPLDVIEARLTERWQSYDYTPARLRAKIDGNDLPNARRVLSGSVGPYDMAFT